MNMMQSDIMQRTQPFVTTNSTMAVHRDSHRDLKSLADNQKYLTKILELEEKLQDFKHRQSKVKEDSVAELKA
jgi:hypothetical protein